MRTNYKFLSFIAFLLLLLAECDNPDTDKILPGRWHPASDVNRKNLVNDHEYEKLIGLGYLQGYQKASNESGIGINDAKKTWKGVNLYVSGHSPSACIMDMNGNTIHQWSYKTASEIWSAPSAAGMPDGAFWRRVHLFPNGDLLAIYEGIALIKLDKNSRLLWKLRGKLMAHHDLEVLDNGTIYVLTRQFKKLPSINNERILDEHISIVSPQGQLLKSYSLIDMIKRSQYRSLLERQIVKDGGFYGHILHANTIEVFDGRRQTESELYKKGNVLVSILMLDLIGIFDLEKQKLVWTMGGGLWAKQHQPTLLSNGHMLIFDNKFIRGKQSRVIEFAPFSQHIFWQYGTQPGQQFYSETCGSCQRLPNGNTLITVTDAGNAMEVTKNGSVVWQFTNPHRAGEKKELIASLFEVIRINPENYGFLPQ